MLLASLDWLPVGLFGFWAFAMGILALFVNIFFALAVHRDAQAHERRVALVSPAVWACATLLGGVLVATAYWLMHHSSLKSPQHGPKARPGDSTDRPSAGH